MSENIQILIQMDVIENILTLNSVSKDFNVLEFFFCTLGNKPKKHKTKTSHKSPIIKKKKIVCYTLYRLPI